MTVRLYNTLTQSLTDFEPLEAGKAKVYLCGLTTYDLAHAGHARTNVTFDVLVRHLRARGFKTTYVRNVTDVDDKILKRASEKGEEPMAFSKRMSDLADRDLAAIGCAKPDHEPRVSTHVAEIIGLIEKLVSIGVAYVKKTPKGNDVYFAVRKFPEYGKLSHRNIDDLLAGARIEASEIKDDPLDFALWKGEGEAWGWESPWGKGRPGWHIECSAMSATYLGTQFDIHCGGMDLIFPHHENEIAQSEAAHGGTFARYWLHGGFLNVDSEKMSKSLGNFVTIQDVLARNDAEALRYYLLQTHYRSPLAFELEKKEDGRVVFPGIDEAERRIDYLYAARQALLVLADGAPPEIGNVLQGQAKIVEETPARVLSALDRDLHTPGAIAAIGELAKAGNEIVMAAAKLKKNKAAYDSARSLAAAAVLALDGSVKPLGLLQAPADDYAARSRERRLTLRGFERSFIDGRVEERRTARANKDFARADAVRDELLAMGVELQDGAGATTWKILA